MIFICQMSLLSNNKHIAWLSGSASNSPIDLCNLINDSFLKVHNNILAFPMVIWDEPRLSIGNVLIFWHSMAEFQFNAEFILIISGKETGVFYKTTINAISLIIK